MTHTDLRGVGDIICWATDRVVGVRLIRLEFTVIAELHVDGSASELSHTGGVVGHHGRRRTLIRHLQKCLQDKGKDPSDSCDIVRVRTSSVMFRR